ncbi:MAG: hypothetical protein ACLQM6_04350 [Acidobacteriaceae bacterium]
MIRFRAVESHRDMCSLPTPHRTPCSVAGMAFNFSKIELAPPAAQSNPAKSFHAQLAPPASARVEPGKFCFETPQPSPMR